MLDQPDAARLSRLYDELRLRLLDLTRRNQLLNYSLSPRSRRFLQIVDTSFEDVHRRLVGDEATLRIAPLPEPDDIPVEERTEDFRAVLDRARSTDLEYLTALEALETTGRTDEIALERLDRQLRDKVRSELGLPQRPARKELNRVDHARTLGINPTLDLTMGSGNLDGRCLQTIKFPDELEAVMEKISGDARLAEQEMGLSTLFLAFGFLEWFESDTADKKAFAPLLLLPVQIETVKIRGKNSYSLSLREGGIEANLSLQKLVETNFGRILPDFDADSEDSVGSVESYFEQVNVAIDGLKRWQLRRWLVLGHFSFGRFAMYADLDPQKWGDIVSHHLIGSILRGVERSGEPNGLPGVPEDYLIDDPAIESLAPFLIQDADASQHSALVDVMKGANLVIQGPPGTGKSQTITNVIANVLASGKRVLFLAEKQAALDVVKRRLDQAGLGQFCLELHSDKASSKSVIERLCERNDLGWGKRSSAGEQKIDPAWRQNRQQVSTYVNALHAEAADGKTVFALMWRALRGRRDFADLADALKSVKLPAHLLNDLDEIAKLSSEVAIFAGVQLDFAREFGHPGKSPWLRVTFGDFAPYDAPRFISALIEFRAHVVAQRETLGRHADLGVRSLDDLAALAAGDRQIGSAPDSQLILAVRNLDLEDLERALSVRLELIGLEDDLSTIPDLRYEDPDRLAIALGYMQGPFSEFEDQTPQQAFEVAEREREMLGQLITALEGVQPVLNVLGLGDSAAASATPAAASAAIVLAMTPAQNRRWLLELANAPQSEIVSAQERWRALVDADSEWTARLQGYRPDGRPLVETIKAIQAASAALRKTGIGKAMATLSRSLSRARELCAGLGIDPDRPDELDALAAHLHDLAAFESDERLRHLLQGAWSGLSTPMDELREAVRIREFLCTKLQDHPDGELVFNKVLALPLEALTSIEPAIEACKRVLALSAPAKARLDARPVGNVRADGRSHAERLSKFLALDPTRRLSGLNASFRRIAHAHNIVCREIRIQKSLAGHATAQAARTIGVNKQAITSAREAIAWIRSVRSTSIPQQSRERLLSDNARSVRASLAQAAAEFAGLEDTRRIVMRQLTEFGVEHLADKPHTELIPLIDSLIARERELATFISLLRVRKQLDSAGLTDFLATCDRKEIEASRLRDLFEAIVAEQRAVAARCVPDLSMNSGASIEARRKAFAERDRAKILVDRQTIKARLLASSPPSGSSVGPKKQWTEMRLLANEFEKQKRFTPVRQLIARAGRAMQALQPCFMMSPLSLAKFVGAGALEFDVLVIDEASQMRPEDALGGMLRSKQLVVVGDPKQLPPTDFFARAESRGSSIEDEGEDLDSESILEACQTTFRERRRLKWHYRSRCESLIAFSNHWFYDDTLITFPTAKPGSFSIELVRVDGAYQNRCNPAEAARVAEEAVSFMRHYANAPEEEIPTLGIVAVNLEQREFIEEELRRLSVDDELVERYRAKADRKGEALFIKNLENVQGDERDHIFISMTYGRKAGEGLVAQNFGPINRKQGHRRLNVLFTRARVRIGLFCSFGSADVRPTETSSDGVHTLKRYLEYAETRGRAAIQSIGGEADSDFELEVAHRLRDKGYKVELQVGVSGFRIDLGVRHPDHTEHFLAGVECDGAAFHSSKSARDRDRLREEVLTSLGWQLVRVWSTDWFDNPELETEKLVRKLEELRQLAASPFTCYPSLECDPAEALRVEGLGENIAIDRPDEAPTNAVANCRQEPDLDQAPSVVVSSLDDRPSSGAEWLSGTGTLSAEAAIQALEAFRETVIRPMIPDWDAQRSILRPAMIETFVKQRVTDPAQWHSHIPQYLRTGTNPTEKNRFLDEICEIVDRIGDAVPGQQTQNGGARQPDRRATQSAHETNEDDSTLYRFADVAVVAAPDRGRFYDNDYTSTLRSMVAQVIDVEGPIFDDVLVDRIARAHAMQRSGSQIARRIRSILPKDAKLSKQGGRLVIWPPGTSVGTLLPFRRDPTGERAYADVPLEELASIAVPLLRLHVDEESVLRRIAEEFGLERVRASARAYFEGALKLAKDLLE